MKEDSPILSSGIIIGIVIAALLIILLIVDISCCIMNRAGLLALMCHKSCEESKEQDIKNECSEKEPLKSGNQVNGEERQKAEAMPMIPTSIKRDTSIDFDFKNATSRTTFAKHSAV